MMPPRFLVLWLTLFAFGVVAIVARDKLSAGILIGVFIPLVLLLQWGIRWTLQRLHCPVWLCRTVMLLLAFTFGFVAYLGSISSLNRQTAAVSVALAGHVPSGIQELHVQEDAWTDYVVWAYFRCEPASLRQILERPPFVQMDYQSHTLSLDQTPFADLRSLPEISNVVVFERTDLTEAKGACHVYTNAAFTFAYIEYGVD